MAKSKAAKHEVPDLSRTSSGACPEPRGGWRRQLPWAEHSRGRGDRLVSWRGFSSEMTFLICIYVDLLQRPFEGSLLRGTCGETFALLMCTAAGVLVPGGGRGL